MAYYENLAIYEKAVELAVHLELSVRGFARYHKYAIGADLRACKKMPKNVNDPHMKSLRHDSTIASLLCLITQLQCVS